MISAIWNGITTVGGFIVGAPAAIIGPIGRGFDRLLGNRNWEERLEGLANRGIDNVEAAGRAIANGVRVIREDARDGARELTVELRNGIQAVHQDGRDLAGVAGVGIRVLHQDVRDGVETLHLEVADGVQVAYRDLRTGGRILHEDLAAVVRTFDGYLAITGKAVWHKITQGTEFGYTSVVAVSSLTASLLFENPKALVCVGMSAFSSPIFCILENTGFAFRVIGVIAGVNALRIGCDVTVAGIVQQVGRVAHHVIANETVQNIVSECGEAGLKALGMGFVAHETWLATTEPSYSFDARQTRMLVQAGGVIGGIAYLKLSKNKYSAQPTGVEPQRPDPLTARENQPRPMQMPVPPVQAEEQVAPEPQPAPIPAPEAIINDPPAAELNALPEDAVIEAEQAPQQNNVNVEQGNQALTLQQKLESLNAHHIRRREKLRQIQGL